MRFLAQQSDLLRRHFLYVDVTQGIELTHSAFTDQTPMRAPGDGEISGYLGIAHDISERQRNDRMKSEFISTVSHELRTPLTAISGALGLLAGGVLGELPDKT